MALTLILALPLSAARAERIMVFAAASLKEAIEEVAQSYESSSGNNVSLSLAGSSVLARQIEQGAPADIFISANPGWMDRLENRGLIESGSRFDFLGNRIVLVGQGPLAQAIEIGPGTDFAALLNGGRLAMALVDAVPAGIYGKAALVTLGQWSSVRSRVVQTDNVRAALALVALGEAPLGVVYATDALAEPGVSVVGSFPTETYPRIVYPAAAIATSGNPANASFLSFLRGEQARAVFEGHGFMVLSGRAK